MAYNLESLIQTLNQIVYPVNHHHPNWVLDDRKKPIIESLLQKTRLLKECLDHNSLSETGNDFSSLGSRIRDAVYHTQNIIESHLTDLLLSKNKGDSIFISPPNSLQKIEDREFEPIFDKLSTLMDSSPPPPQPLPSPRNLNPKNIVVGLSQNLRQLKEEHIMGGERELKVIPIVGMGGIGKTTLARTLYNDPEVVRKFDIRLWAVASQNYNDRGFLLALVKSHYTTLSALLLGEDNSQLITRLHKVLYGRRYLIVLDDIWGYEAWYCLQLFAKDEKIGSRILVTTRDQTLVKNFPGHVNYHQMKFLNETDSWDLLSRSVSPEGKYPAELEEAGKIIANKCKGLPLTIHVVGGVLSCKERTREAWMKVAEDVSSFAENDEHHFNILSLSYRYLPDYLKPLFLYLGAFPEDWEIQSTTVIKLWIAEGLLQLQPMSNASTFEETAKVYIKELVERNLLMARKLDVTGIVKSYSMHDLIRDLCIKKAHEENFLHVGSTGGSVKKLNPNNTPRLRLSAVYGSYDQLTRIINGAARFSPVIPSLLIFGNRDYDREMSWVQMCELRLLRVLDMLAVTLPTVPKAVEKLFHLRYLAARLGSYSNLTSSLSNLCELQTLIFYQDQIGGLPGDEVQGFFDLPQLRHIKFKRRFPLFVLQEGEDVTLHEHLQTLWSVAIDDSFSKILAAVPNLKKLGIFKHNRTSVSSPIDLTCLSKLETLKCSSGSEWSPGVVPPLIFPDSLQKLVIHRCGIPTRGCLNAIGSLPNLQELKLRYSSFPDSYTWEPTEGEFPELRVLYLEQVRLEKWIADETHYPKLKRVLIIDCSFLEEIPQEVGTIDTLESIEVRGATSRSVLESALKIEQERDDFGNATPQVLTESARIDGFKLVLLG